MGARAFHQPIPTNDISRMYDVLTRMSRDDLRWCDRQQVGIITLARHYQLDVKFKENVNYLVTSLRKCYSQKKAEQFDFTDTRAAAEVSLVESAHLCEVAFKVERTVDAAFFHCD